MSDWKSDAPSQAVKDALDALASPPGEDDLDLDTVHVPRGPLTPICPPEHREQAADLSRCRDDLQRERERASAAEEVERILCAELQRERERTRALGSALQEMMTAAENSEPPDGPWISRAWYAALQLFPDGFDRPQRPAGLPPPRDAVLEAARSRSAAAEQRLREVEGEYSKLATHSAAMRSERDSALSDLAALRKKIQEKAEEWKRYQLNDGWSPPDEHASGREDAHRDCADELLYLLRSRSSDTVATGSASGAGNPDGGEGRGGKS